MGGACPFSSTGTNGERVAGVRYRAWCPPSALHPTIGVHAPLTFDVLDTWNDRSIAGCRYHVSHPGGLAHANFPQNSFEAEKVDASPVLAFWTHTGRIKVPVVEANPLFPYTLDLRRGIRSQGEGGRNPSAHVVALVTAPTRFVRKRRSSA